MYFWRWLKYRLVRIGALLAALVSFFGGVYSFFFISEPAKLYVAAAGFILGIVLLIISTYYKTKLQNLFFIQSQKKEEPKPQPTAEA